jgi:hypothetical protein
MRFDRGNGFDFNNRAGKPPLFDNIDGRNHKTVVKREFQADPNAVGLRDIDGELF